MKANNRQRFQNRGISFTTVLVSRSEYPRDVSTDTSFEKKMMVKSGAIAIIFKSNEPFQSYLLTGQAETDKKAG